MKKLNRYTLTLVHIFFVENKNNYRRRVKLVYGKSIKLPEHSKFPLRSFKRVQKYSLFDIGEK